MYNWYNTRFKTHLLEKQDEIGMIEARKYARQATASMAMINIQKVFENQDYLEPEVMTTMMSEIVCLLTALHADMQDG